MAPLVLEPSDAATAAAFLAQSASSRTPVVVRGGGTKLAWSTPAGHDGATLSTRCLNRPIQHFAGDLVATLPAGVTLEEANAELGRERQWLPLDPPHHRTATIGGIVASNDSGPRRHQYGAPRDLIIGVEVALADGRVARAGGRVVKNVAGYDLSRLLCGSFGTLGVIASATFKLIPLPPASATLMVTTRDIGQAQAIAAAIATAPLTPTAIELQAFPVRLLVRFETTPQAVARQAAIAGDIAARAGAAAKLVDGSAEAQTWTEHESMVWSGVAGATIVKLSVLPSEVSAVLGELGPGSRGRQASSVIGRLALGVLYARIEGAADEQAAAAAALRRRAGAKQGSLVVLEAPDAVRALVPAWEIDPGAFSVMQAVKQRFDPHGILSGFSLARL